jgi:hypothetical protein
VFVSGGSLASVTRSGADVDAVQATARDGARLADIVRATGVPRATARDWLAGKVPKRSGGPCDGERCRAEIPPAKYARLLGAYLGDGYIAAFPRDVYRFTLYQDAAYVRLVEEWRELAAAMFGGKVSVQRSPGCAIVTSYSKHWPCLIPQHGPGAKHLRPIVLEPWQRTIVDAHPRELLKGLMESDGCRHINRVTTRGKQYEYVRYSFSNASADIRHLFTLACDLVGVGYTRCSERVLAVSRHDDVELLDRFIGPKS